ncbi:phosphoribosyltransferase [Lacticigenium naphthae]|uniref:phosphoribosyltransferase n=1 Tax=Lacticigenium naphthae TaxID=515351 RepID=UPI0004230B2A|nr:phosphoribosyltransferase family protein [Lacticigenium naphthae]
MRFIDRKDAGTQLASALQLTDTDNAVVVALPRGGIPVGLEIAEKYHLPFDMVLSKKIGHPLHSEYAVGAVSEYGDPLLNTIVIDRLDQKWINKEISRLRKAMESRRKKYSQVLSPRSLKDKIVIIVDDGIATGLTMKVAIEAVRKQEAKEIIVAVPIIPRDTYHELLDLVDQVVAVDVPEVFLGAVGAYYSHFPQVDDEEVIASLKSFSDPDQIE